MKFQVADMCIILHIDFVHIALIAILAVEGSAIIYILNFVNLFIIFMMMFKLNMAQWPGRLIYFQHAGVII